MSNAQEKIRQFWHDQFAPFNVGRDFIVLFGKLGSKPSLALLQVDGGEKINTGNIRPVTPDGEEIILMVKTKG